MSQPYIGEIRMFGFARVPQGWFACNGALLPISQYDTLFSLIGTTYGGDGMTTFAVPDLRGRLPVHQGTGSGLGNYVLGQSAGSETVTLTVAQLPPHDHAMRATTAIATASTPGPGLMPAAVSGDAFYVDSPTGNNALAMAPQMVAGGGGSLPHDNLMPTLTVQYCIAVYGIYPSPN